MTVPGADLADQLADIFARHRVVDLTVPLAEELPCTWPGHMPFRATVWTWFAERDGVQPVHPRMGGAYQTRWLVMDEHVGTHVDAPRHFVPPADSGLPNAGPGGAIGVDGLALLAACGAAAVVDVAPAPAQPGSSPPIGSDQLLAWERAHGEFGSGDVVLLRSGWSTRYRTGDEAARYTEDVLVRGSVPGWPAPSPAAIDLLVERGVRCLGTDGPSVGAAQDGAPAHLAGLTRGMVYVEALTGLAALPARGAWFLFLPIRLVGGTGGPGRALAVLPEPAASHEEAQ